MCISSPGLICYQDGNTAFAQSFSDDHPQAILLPLAWCWFTDTPRLVLRPAQRGLLGKPAKNWHDARFGSRGTPTYMSPEPAAGGEVVDARSDIYSVGGLAYFLLTGRPPFADRTAVRVLAAHLYEAPEPPTKCQPDIPADLEAVVLRCLAKSPADRFSDAASLNAGLAGCVGADLGS